MANPWPGKTVKVTCMDSGDAVDVAEEAEEAGGKYISFNTAKNKDYTVSE